MAKREGENTSRRHIWIYDSDWEWLMAQFGDNVGTSKAIRTIIRTYRKQIEAKAALYAQRPEIQLTPTDLATIDPDELRESSDPGESSEPG